MLFILKDFVTTRYCKSTGNESRLQYTEYLHSTAIILISEEQDIQQCHHDESNHTLAVLQHTVQQQVVFNYRNASRFCNESLLYGTKFIWINRPTS